MPAQAFSDFSGSKGQANQPTNIITSDGFAGPPLAPFNPNNPTFAAAPFLAGMAMGPGSFLTESSTDGITAFAAGGQAGATLLSSEVNRISVAAAIGASIKLPPSQPGLTIFVINHGANAIQVYGSGTDTIDDAATATGVAQMSGSMAIFSCTTAGFWYAEGLGTGYSGGLQTVSYTTGIIAHAGGGQAAAMPLTTSYNNVTTVATAADSVKLPASAPGLQITVTNNGANSLQLYGAGADTINGSPTATGVAVGAGKTAVLTCYAAGAWSGPLTLA